ncbi:MAG: GWxTD domain-containing protein [bacterium]|nr:MAG: GWxTD domain-containing protein [bacterium]
MNVRRLTHGLQSILPFAALAALTILPAGLEAAQRYDEAALIDRLLPGERDTLFAIQYLMNPFQQKQYLTLETADERRAWIECLWLGLDPTPATETNEMRIEHWNRVRLARELFGLDKAPGWDKRGEVLIRFGIPTRREENWGNIGYYRVIPVGETWYYGSIGMTVSFQDITQNGEYCLAHEIFGPTSRQIVDFRRGEQFLNMDEIDYIASPDMRRMIGVLIASDFLKERVAVSPNRFLEGTVGRACVYRFDLEEPLPAYFDVTAFRGGPGAVRTEVNFEIPLDAIKCDTVTGGRHVELRVIARDMQMREVVLATDSITTPGPADDPGSPDRLVPGRVICTLEPGYYRLGVEAIDRGSGKRCAFRTTVDLPDFDSRLTVSDILFASRISELEQISRFARGTLEVVPHPVHAYVHGDPLILYFEIYGLDTDRDGLAFYQIRYRIDPIGKRRRGPVLVSAETAVSSLFEMSGFGASQIQRLEIATDNLWKGIFELTVEIMDRRTRESTVQSARFSIVNR